MKKRVDLILTCEHASNFIPKEFTNAFDKRIVSSHQGWDIGAKNAAEYIAKKLNVPLNTGKISRLIIDLNRSSTHNKYLSQHTKQLDQKIQHQIINKYYLPFRENTKNLIEKMRKKQNVILHISVHSFTPTLNYQERNNDIGILYDPKNLKEKQFSRLWASALNESSKKDLKTRFNYPYLGKSDGHTTSLRKLYKDSYIGIELEINQKLADKKNNSFPKSLLNLLCDSLKIAVAQLESGKSNAN